jgi:hypothetical protein
MSVPIINRSRHPLPHEVLAYNKNKARTSDGVLALFIAPTGLHIIERVTLCQPPHKAHKPHSRRPTLWSERAVAPLRDEVEP